MNSNEIKNAIGLVTANGGVPFITSSPGLGKSDTVRQYAEAKAKELKLKFFEGPEAYDENKFGFIDLRLATIDSIDLGGLPIIDRETESTQFTRSPYIPAEGRGVLFLDELPQAKPANQAALSQLILDKRVGTHSLGDGWEIVTAGNRAKDRAATHKMPTHIANRLTHLEMDFDIDAFAEFMHTTKIHDIAISFAKFRPALFDKFNPDLEVNCTPRSFIASSHFIDAPYDVSYPLMAGTIGEGPTAEFVGFINIYKNLPEFSEFVAKPTTIEIPEKSDVLYACIQLLSSNAKTTNIDKIASFIDRLKDAPEYIIMFYKEALNKNSKLLTAKPVLDFIKQNKEVMI